MTIREVKDEDIGIWSCSASVDNQEYSDVIYFSVEGSYQFISYGFSWHAQITPFLFIVNLFK